MSSVEYKFQRQEGHERAPARRNLLIVILGLFHAAFIILFAFFAKYEKNATTSTGPNLYPSKCAILFQNYSRLWSFDKVTLDFQVFMDVHSMMFVGFGFLMTFLKRYGFGSLTFNLLIASFVLEWALIVRGFLGNNFQAFQISLEK